MWNGRITSVAPVVAGAPGRIPWGRIEIDYGNRSMAMSYKPRQGSRSSRVEFACAPPARSFDTCPICLADPADTVEHVPNGALGGQPVTKTCVRCNNRLGSGLEPHLMSWVSESWQRTRFSANGVRGQRTLPRIDLRWTDDGKFGLLVAGAVPRAVDAALRRGGQFTLTIPKPDMARVRLAALKHAYLASCLALGEIARGPTADLIRGVLTFVRDIRAREPIPNNIATWVEGVQIDRTYRPPGGPPIAIMTRGPVPDAGPADAWVCLAGVMMVRWPLPEFTLVSAA